jgi:tungstate transport system substrate-binding protein
MRQLGSLVAILLSAAVTLACSTQQGELRLATTTSVDNSGLLAAILPAFEQEADIKVKVLAVGSGRAIRLLQRGDADVAITHDPVAEAALLKEVPGLRYRKVMFNDFLIAGPPDDPARVRRAATAPDAMRRIASSTTPFASRGDESGTHARERQLWAAAGATPLSTSLLETGQGMAPTLRIASERRAYTLTDRATYMQLGPSLALRPLFEGDPDLLNTYAAIALLGAERDPLVQRLMAWLGEGDGRARIAGFSPSPTGARPFTVWPAGRPHDSPEALPR